MIKLVDCWHSVEWQGCMEPCWLWPEWNVMDGNWWVYLLVDVNDRLGLLMGLSIEYSNS